MTVRVFSPPVAVVLGGLVAGTLDIGAACLINSVGAVVVLQAIAGGVMGRASYQGGLQTAVLGLSLQWAMSILIAAIFVLGTAVLPALRRFWLRAGLAYGAVVFAVMNYAVMPLSAIGRAPHFTPITLVANLGAMLLFGVIIAWFARSRAA